MRKRSFLFANTYDVCVNKTSSAVYDSDARLNVVVGKNGFKRPVCSIPSMITNSKSENYPGDDDPDPDMEFCY